MFVGRQKELNKLNEMYHDDQFQCIIMYGRRRVGKTYLLTEWMKDKIGIYFAFEQQNIQVLLDKFSEVVLEQMPSEYITSFDDFRQIITYIAEHSKDRPVALILDEVQYLAMQDKGFISMLQNLIDQLLLTTKLKLVLCGSYVSFMENEFLAHKSPIFGRRTASFKIEPFRYQDSAKILNMEDKIQEFQSWCILGGMPLYLKQFDKKRSLKKNIIDKVLEKGMLLHNEPIFALKQELKEPALYFSIIEAISSGRSKYNEISTFVGTDVGYYLNTLVQLGIIEKMTPIGEKSSSRKSIYRMKDPFFLFWFRYVSRSYSLVEMEKQELLYDTKIKPDLPSYFGLRFEDFCMEYMASMNGTAELPMIFTEIGKWWGTNNKTKRQEEIDIVAFGCKNDAIIAECKWRNEKTRRSELEKLEARGMLIQKDNRYLMFFSKAGFTSGAKKFALDKDILLIEFKDMVQ